MKRMLTSLLLQLLGCLSPPKPGPQPQAKIQRMIILRFGGIGDVIVLTGLIRTLRQMYPAAEISLVTDRTCAAVVERNPDLDRVIISGRIALAASVPQNYRNFLAVRKLASRPYDLAFFAHNDFHSLFFAFFLPARYKVGFDTNGRGFDFALTHSVPIYSKSLALTKQHTSRHLNAHFHDLLWAFYGKEGSQSRPRVHVSNEELNQACDWLAQRGLGQPLVVFTLGGTEVVKRWPIDRFATLARRCAQELGATVLVLGGPEERSFCGRFSQLHPRISFAAGALPLRDSMSLLKLADVVIGNDTGLIHAAAALDIPTITIFGPTPSAVYGYESSRSIIVKADLPCLPCSQASCLLLTPGAGSLTPPCLNAVSVNEVMAAVKKLLLHSAREKNLSHLR